MDRVSINRPLETLSDSGSHTVMTSTLILVTDKEPAISDEIPPDPALYKTEPAEIPEASPPMGPPGIGAMHLWIVFFIVLAMVIAPEIYHIMEETNDD